MSAVHDVFRSTLFTRLPRLLAHIILVNIIRVSSRSSESVAADHATFLKSAARTDRRVTADALPRPVTIACVNSLVHENVSRLVSNAISP